MSKIYGSVFISYLVLMIYCISGEGCASVVPPQGGIRDSLPPALIDVRPGDSSLNFETNRIVFSFDEYVDVDPSSQAILISPLQRSTPLVTRKLNVVTVRLRDSLEANTTYSINFGKAIKDINEGNILNGYTYLFSTGDYLDSLQLTGRVLLAETGQIDTTLTVLLHTSSTDSAVIRQKPRYITHLDSRGYFRFRYLPNDTFYIYAVAGQGGQYLYTNPNRQLFAFHDSAIITGNNNEPIALNAYLVNEKPASTPIISVTKNSTAEKRLRFQTTLNGDKQDLLNKLSLTFETKLKEFDSTKARLYTDSVYNPVQGYQWTLDSARKILTLTNTWQENKDYRLILAKDFATDSAGRQLFKTDTIKFATRATVDYGKLSMRFRNLDLSKNPILLFYESDKLMTSFPVTSNVFNAAMILPADYEMRILYDYNKNGKWDPGIFFGKNKTQPELVLPVQRKITVKANWSNEFEIDVKTSTGPKLPETRPVTPAPTPRRSRF